MSAIIIGMEELNGKFARLAAVGDGSGVTDALEAGGRVIQIYAQDNIRNKLNKHPTGFLVNEVKIKREGKDILVGVWGVIYAAIHEFGGVITAKNKFLAIPLPGVTGNPSNYDLHFQGYGGVVGTLADKSGHVMFILVRSVHMPARPYLRPAVDDHIQDITNAIIVAVIRLIDGAVK